jgi:endonuclease YncB( thermonuclease family)
MIAQSTADDPSAHILRAMFAALSRRLTLALLAATLACVAQARNPQTLAVKVTSIADGDTINVVDAKGRRHRIRLSGIDAPEMGQPFGAKSRQSLAGMALGKPAWIEWSKVDPYGRLVAKVLIPPPGCALPCTARIDVNLAQLEAGMAWFYRHYQNEQPKADRSAYAAAESRARERKAGVWSEARPVPPWEWRRRSHSTSYTIDTPLERAHPLTQAARHAANLVGTDATQPDDGLRSHQHRDHTIASHRHLESRMVGFAAHRARQPQRLR